MKINHDQHIKKRYQLLRKYGFSSKDANKYKYRKTSRVHDIVSRKKRYDKLLPFLEYNESQAWQMAGSYTDSDVDHMILTILSKK